MSVAPFSAPSNENWLKFLSSIVPTSVTTPTFHCEAAVLGGTDAGADPDGAGVDAAVADGAGVAGAVLTDGDGVAAVLHAEISRASPLNRARPMERVRILPPPKTSLAGRPLGLLPTDRTGAAIIRPVPGGRLSCIVAGPLTGGNLRAAFDAWRV
jgi:hypothetical protein